MIESDLAHPMIATDSIPFLLHQCMQLSRQLTGYAHCCETGLHTMHTTDVLNKCCRATLEWTLDGGVGAVQLCAGTLM